MGVCVCVCVCGEGAQGKEAFRFFATGPQGLACLSECLDAARRLGFVRPVLNRFGTKPRPLSFGPSAPFVCLSFPDGDLESHLRMEPRIA